MTGVRCLGLIALFVGTPHGPPRKPLRTKSPRLPTQIVWRLVSGRRSAQGRGRRTRKGDDHSLPVLLGARAFGASAATRIRRCLARRAQRRSHGGSKGLDSPLSATAGCNSSNRGHDCGHALGTLHFDGMGAEPCGPKRTTTPAGRCVRVAKAFCGASDRSWRLSERPLRDCGILHACDRRGLALTRRRAELEGGGHGRGNSAGGVRRPCARQVSG